MEKIPARAWIENAKNTSEEIMKEEDIPLLEDFDVQGLNEEELRVLRSEIRNRVCKLSAKDKQIRRLRRNRRSAFRVKNKLEVETENQIAQNEYLECLLAQMEQDNRHCEEYVQQLERTGLELKNLLEKAEREYKRDVSHVGTSSTKLR
eukprot:CAMPEP_0184701196 /NCGR_PEP_ID=MMETSP0313-20130426/18575_1 /TAXON_ID=2792 /ORGANISM="Porphyridium aerugineum, Strain SAG 1380-2" /LENGTH=148 /DNA_ID=CAMNT_0027161171 /DNA_START=101 /DNA_END=547 /DNA_ORIENTATION=+